MGTSISQRSPETSNWRAVAAGYTSDVISVERTVQEIWRAATNQPEGNLPADLGNPIVAECLRIAINSNSREEAAMLSSREIAFSGQASLAADIAQRAVVKAFRGEEDRVIAFTKSLFSEAGNYFVSRDLPGYIGDSGRARNISESISLKNDICEQIARTVSTVPRPDAISSDAAIWRSYVNDVVNRLAGRE